MQKHVLVLNAGSSSLKFALVEPDSGARRLRGQVDRIGGREPALSYAVGERQEREPLAESTHEAALAAVFGLLRREAADVDVLAVGHRVVHGGERFHAPASIDDDVVAAIEAVSHLAPLHNPHCLRGIRAARRARPELLHVAVFDTAFHQTMPEHAYRYAVPESWYREHGVRRYGFHGTSHDFVAREAARELGRELGQLCLVTAHLGNGSSVTAVDGGRSVENTMGMTPLSGVVMGTRSGDIDPGAVLFMAQRLPGGVEEVDRVLNRESGLRGLSGVTNDVRELLAAEARGDARAQLALDVFCYRLAGAIAALCVALPRLDALVFTGGIGENASSLRRRTVARLRPLGLELDAAANEAPPAVARTAIIDAGRGPRVLVVKTDEEWMIAKATFDLHVQRGGASEASHSSKSG
jgi:acetate kinase